MRAELLYDTKAILGEGPVWDARTQTIYWLDILNKRIYAGGELLLQLDGLVGCIAPRKNGGLILASSNGDQGRLTFSTVETGSGSLKVLYSLNDEPVNHRFNDGKCDPRGRFLAGTMNLNEKDPVGSLYSFDGKAITRLLGGATISNGMTWSPDYKTFYYIDTPTREVMAFDYNLETGAVASPHRAAYVPEALGWPDGMTSDMQGNLWIAMWGGAQVTKWDPNTGQLLERIPIPAKNVSSCVFGGRDMNELYITSARKELDEATLKEYPLTGGVFRLKTKVEGMPVFEFAG
jgi:sugar lactone lactonase YvrE